MSFYEVNPLKSIHGEEIINVFRPSRIDNSKIMIGCQNSERLRAATNIDLGVVSLDSGWNVKHEQLKFSKEKRREKPYPVLQLNSHPTEGAGPIHD